MGWFEKKDKDGAQDDGSADRASLANLANPTDPQPQQALPSTPAAPAAAQPAAQQASIFGETADIEGSVEGHGDVVLRGTVRGSIHVTGALVIEASGRVQADVAAREVVNAGTVEGNIIAAERVRVASTGVVDGDIDAPSIVIDDGGGVEGFIQMEPPGGEDIDDEDDEFVPPPPIKGLRSSLPAGSSTRPAAAPPRAAAPATAAKPAVPASPAGLPRPSEPRSPELGAHDGRVTPSAAPPGPPATAPRPPSQDSKPSEPGGNGNGEGKRPDHGDGRPSQPLDPDATQLSSPGFQAAPAPRANPASHGDDETKTSGPLL